MSDNLQQATHHMGSSLMLMQSVLTERRYDSDSEAGRLFDQVLSSYQRLLDYLRRHERGAPIEPMPEPLEENIVCGSVPFMPDIDFPTDEEWTPEMVDFAGEEGWGLFECGGSANGRTQLQRCDEEAIFEEDQDAWAFVAHCASQGSAVHQRALDLVEKYNSKEWAAICRHLCRQNGD